MDLQFTVEHPAFPEDHCFVCGTVDDCKCPVPVIAVTRYVTDLGADVSEGCAGQDYWDEFALDGDEVTLKDLQSYLGSSYAVVMAGVMRAVDNKHAKLCMEYWGLRGRSQRDWFSEEYC